MTSSQNAAGGKTGRRGGRIALVIATVLTAGFGLGAYFPATASNEPTASETAAPSESPNPSEAPATVTCETTGPASYTPNQSFQVVLDGLPRDSAESAQAAAIEAAETNPVFVAGIAMERGMQDGAHVEASSLVDDDGCWTEEGFRLSLMVQGSIESAAPSLGTAPENGTNSAGDNEGNLVVSADQGIWGDTQALILTHADGTQTVILLRCGNIVFTTPPPSVPTGPTDNPPVEERPECPLLPPGNGLPPWHPECIDKPDSNNVTAPQGTTPLGVGGQDSQLTDGNQSSNQQQQGQTSGSVADSPVPAGTGSGGSTPQVPGITAPGATPAPAQPAPAPAPEPGVNPTEPAGPGGPPANEGDPGNPFG